MEPIQVKFAVMLGSCTDTRQCVFASSCYFMPFNSSATAADGTDNIWRWTRMKRGHQSEALNA